MLPHFMSYSINMNNSPRKYQCPKCFKSYSQSFSMTRHLRLECGVAPQFKCPYCIFESNRKGNINRHVILKHGLLPADSRLKLPFDEKKWFIS